MKTTTRRAIVSVLISALWFNSLSMAAVPTALTHTPINPIPPNILSTPALPLVMLNMSKDHQLFYRAYNEFSDYNNDGSPDGTYLHTVRYSGYFDTTKCYTYSAADSRFAPSVAVSTTNTCSTAWHGNFLNWATMTRMDVLRKVLYGGNRSTDDAALTVLERASLPMDAHSFAKYYANGTVATADRPDISSITPFAVTELTMCNATLGGTTTLSHTNTNPPLLRVASGNFSLWNAHERRQCIWSEENAIWAAAGGGNGNSLAITGLAASAGFPSRATRALPAGGTGDFIVRVEACNSALVGAERCRTYPSGNLKPIGLLQEYGETDLAEFGLITGSFSNNISGGVLRKNASSFRNEVNASTNGTFTGAAGIVSNLSALKVYGYGYNQGTYAGDGNCTFQLTGLADNQCTSWGNPIGEMFIEVLRYLRGTASSTTGPATAYGSGADAKGAEMGLTVSAWVDPFTRGATVDSVFGAPQCRPINVINVNASVTSYDRDTVVPFGTLGAAGTLNSYVDAVGDGEGLRGTARFVGRTAASTDRACTAKTIGNLSDADGICPVAPAYQGSYTLAGAAFWANTNPVRPVPNTLTGDDALKAFRVRSYAVALAPGVPRITVKTTGANPRTAVIQPSYRLQLPGGGVGAGTLVDFRVIEQTPTSGRYLVVWEDSEQGGDYDQDASGILTWSLNGNTLSVTTQTFAAATANPQGFGYTVSGTDRDGVHFHSGILGFSFTDPTNLPVTQSDGLRTNLNLSGGCQNCGVNQPATTATYTMAGTAGQALQDPLWYAAKWGGFRTATGVPAAAPGAGPLWDSINNLSGAAVADGVPDNFYEVFNPDQLEQALRRVFNAAVVANNASPAISAPQLTRGSYKYVASFDSTRLNGNIQAYAVSNTTGDFATVESWNVGSQLGAAAVSTRQIITNDQNLGISFDWNTINARTAYRNLITGGTNAVDVAQAERIVRFVRGDRTVEGANGIRNRDPGGNIMGPIVNASPWMQDRPSARFVDSLHPGYAAFAAANRTRQKLLWAGAGDGMLHAFNADNGSPVMSYVPEALAPRLNELPTATSVRALVDGSPFSADVDLNAGISTTRDWRTLVFGTLGRGGKGIFALDGTNVGTLAAAATGTNPAAVFRWQFTANDDSDLGHILSDIAIEPGTGQPTPIVKLQNGQFAAVFGNGYGSSNGRAALFILPMAGPSNTGSWTGRYHKIVLDSPAGGGNGLSTPTLVDTNNDGLVDTAYAGDLRGNLWKINLSSATPSAWTSAYAASSVPTPLYVATSSDGTTRLPITGAPQFSFPPFGGVLVTFATGLSVLQGDFPQTTRTQRFYGIWDRPAFASGTRALPRGTTTLEARSFTRQSNGQITVATTGGIDYLNAVAATARDGWYFNLPGSPGSSEMVLSNLGVSARNVAITTVRSAATNQCSGTPVASFLLIDPLSGAPSSAALGQFEISTGVFVNVAGIDIADQRVRVVNDATNRTLPPTAGSNVPGPPVCPDGTAALRLVGQATDKSLCFRQSNARFQWREIPGLRTLN